MRAFLTLPILWLAAAPTFAEDPLVVLATTRAGRIEAFDARLGRLGSIGVSQLVESVSGSPDGRKLYIAQEQRGQCCGLYSLDLETHTMCAFGGAAMFAVPSPDGQSLFTQDSQGVQVFDAKTLWPRAPSIKAPGTYNLQVSPDGQWLLGITNSEGPSLDIFDVNRHTLARRLPIPTGPAIGAWAGDGFYLFSYAAPGIGNLWHVKPQDTELPEAKKILLEDLHGNCNEPVLLMLAGAPDKLFLAEAFGYKLDRRGTCPGIAPGGIYRIQPTTGHVSLLAPGIHVNRMAVTPDGHDVYVIQSTNPPHHSDVRLIHIDADMGHIQSSVALESGDWNLTLTHTPEGLIPRGYVRAALHCPR